jgi:peptide/nickel transport system substrate-binding protein
MKSSTIALGLLASATLVVSSGGGGGNSARAASGDIVDGGTFTMTLSADPGNLDPQSSPASTLFQVSEFAYDALLSMDPEDGAIQSGLATDWSVDGTVVTLALADGITCSDGSALTASDVVANLDYVANPDNQSPFLGTYYPVGATAVADDAAGTVTITLAAPAPFVLNGLSDLPIVCAAGMADRAALASATFGTGPYVLSEAALGDHYTYTIREGYTWGPNGAGTDVEGMPDSIVVRIVENPATAANLLLTGDVNAAAIIGPDAQRLEQEDLFYEETAALLGEMWFNHAEARPAADPAVRMALLQAVDLTQLQQVLTAGQGSAATTFATLAPVACPGDSVSAALPPFDVEAAGQILDDAGWVVADGGTRAKDGQALSVTFLHDTGAGPAGLAAAELATEQWKALGVDVVDKAQGGTATQETLFGTGDWDIAWVALNVSSPDQLVPFLSGPGMADGGANFAAVANADYEAGVQAAAAMQSTDGCPTWLGAESQLVAGADVVPFANTVVKTFGNGAEFIISGSLLPTSIRMISK